MLVHGSFNGWQSGLPMIHDILNPSLFSLPVDVRSGEAVQFKFVVDGVWRINPDFPTMRDEKGNWNNEISIRSACAYFSSNFLSRC